MAEINHCSLRRSRKVASSVSNADGWSRFGLKQMPMTFSSTKKHSSLVAWPFRRLSSNSQMISMHRSKGRARESCIANRRPHEEKGGQGGPPTTMFAHGKLAKLVVMMSPRLGPRLTLFSMLPWTVMKIGAKSGAMSHAPANTTLSWPKRNFKAMEAVPAPAHSSKTDSPAGKLTKDATVSIQTGSAVHGGWVPKNCCPSSMLASSWMDVNHFPLPNMSRKHVQERVEVRNANTEAKNTNGETHRWA